MKRMSISICDWVYHDFIENFEGNRSRFIEGLIIHGLDNTLMNENTLKQKLILANNQIMSLQEKVRGLELKTQYQKKDKWSRYTLEQRAQIAIMKSKQAARR